MLEDIKKELLNNPEKLKEVLEHFGYCNIVIRPTYMQFGRDEESSKKSIVIKLENNNWLYVHDYARNIQTDIFSYITNQRKVEFVDILNEIKNVLHIQDYIGHFQRKGIFGGFYEKIRQRNTIQSKIYDEKILDKFQFYPNIRFLKDHISLDAQQYFGIRYDVESQGIVIPIRNEYGQLIGVKERFNYEISDGALKYFYSYPGRCSTTLFGYTQNYQYLVENTVFVGEAEKFVMQCYSYGYRNAVALMSGSLSVQQARLLVELHPTKVIFLHDQGYELDNIKRNVEVLHHYSKFAEFEIGYWDWTKSYYAPKVSATDMGKEKFEYIINNEILILGDDKDEEEL